MERVRSRRDRLLGAAERPMSQFRNEVRTFSLWIQESWNIMSAMLPGEETVVGNRRKIEVSTIVVFNCIIVELVSSSSLL